MEFFNGRVFIFLGKTKGMFIFARQLIKRHESLMKNIIDVRFFVWIFILSLASGYASETGSGHEPGKGGEKEKFDVGEMVAHHLSDTHDYVLELPFIHKEIHLPVILWTDKGLSIFSSSEFRGDNDGKVVVTDGKGNKFVRIHEVIYYADKVHEGHPGVLDFDSRPLDFSITRNVIAILFVFVLLFLVLYYTRKAYENPKKLPKGIAGFIEPIILFIRDDVAIPNIGEKYYEKYMPYLLTVFFFILFSNLIGLIPFAPFGHNITGNIMVTFVLAVFTFILTTFSGRKHYWQEIFTPHTPKLLWPIMIPIEISGMFIKPFALMVRLFANIFAGHTIMLSLVALIFLFGTVAVSPVSGLFIVFMSFIELLVAFLQAYIFTVLSALFIGLAVGDHEEEHDTEKVQAS
jgi:F-type H+-transporting ATPase subunit a